MRTPAMDRLRVANALSPPTHRAKYSDPLTRAARIDRVGFEPGGFLIFIGGFIEHAAGFQGAREIEMRGSVIEGLCALVERIAQHRRARAKFGIDVQRRGSVNF